MTMVWSVSQLSGTCWRIGRATKSHENRMTGQIVNSIVHNTPS
jgi:hypothetical protein